MKNFSINITISSNRDEDIKEISENIENYLDCVFDDSDYIGLKIDDLDKSK